MYDYIEETIQTPNLKDEEIESYFLNEKLSQIEKVSYLLKKGQPLQREALLTNLCAYLPNKEVLQNIILITIDYIEIWSEKIQKIFSNSLKKLFLIDDEESLFTNTFEIVNEIFSFTIKLITQSPEEISIEYLKVFETLVDFYSKYKKINLEKETVEMAITLGSFGRTLKERRFSVFLCSGLIRVLEVTNEDLINRIMIISTSPERILRAEVIHNLRFLVDYFDETYVEINFFKILDHYLEEETEHNFLETIITTLYIISSFPNEKFLLNKTNQIITNHFKNIKEVTINESYHPFYKSIFLGMISYSPMSPEDNPFLSNIMTFLNTFIFSGKYQSDTKNQTYNYDYILEQFDSLCLILKGKYDNVINELLLTFVGNKNLYEFKSVVSHLETLLVNLDVNFINKNLISKLYNYLDSPKEESKLISHIILNLSPLLEFTDRCENEETVMLFWNSFIKFDDYLMTYDSNWRDTENFVLSLCNVKFIYYINEQSCEILLNFVKKHFKRQSYPVQKVLIKFLVCLLKYSKEPIHSDVMKFIQNEICSINSFYYKRHLLSFIEEAAEFFSVNFLKEKGLINHFLNFLNMSPNGNNLLIKRTLSCLKNFMIILHKDSEANFSVSRRIEILRKSSKDNEVLEALNEYNLWNVEFMKECRKNSFEEQIQSDSLKYKQELKFLERDISFIKPFKKLSDSVIYSTKSKSSSKKSLTFVKTPTMEKSAINNFRSSLEKKKQNTLTAPTKIQSSKNLNSFEFKSPLMKKDTLVKSNQVKILKLSDTDLLNVKDSLLNLEKNSSSSKDTVIKRNSTNNYSIMLSGVTVDVESKTITRRNSITSLLNLTDKKQNK